MTIEAPSKGLLRPFDPLGLKVMRESTKAF